MSESQRSSLKYIDFDSIIGTIRIEGTPDAITRLRLPGESLPSSYTILQVQSSEGYPSLTGACNWLKSYFGGSTDPWNVLELASMTDFTKEIYRALSKVPFGSAITYGQLAAMAGRPKAARAVGRAMATNPFPILIPCHRVLGSDGSLHGYGGGLPMKRLLLEHEGIGFDSVGKPLINV